MVLDLSDPQLRNQVQLLIVDESPQIRLAIGSPLSLIGYQVEEAASAQEIFTLLSANRYDLVIMDIALTDMCAVEILQKMRIEYPDIIIIVLTGNPSIESAIEAVRSNVFDYLVKPTNTDEIIDTVTSALQSQATRKQKEYLLDTLDKLHQLKTDNEKNGNGFFSGGQTYRPLLIVPPLQLNQKDLSATIFDVSGDRLVSLTKGETAVLASLMMYPDQTLDCSTIVRYAWRYEIDETDARTMIRPYIFRLRKKLESDPKKPLLIKTTRNQGYSFATPSKNVSLD